MEYYISAYRSRASSGGENLAVRFQLAIKNTLSPNMERVFFMSGYRLKSAASKQASIAFFPSSEIGRRGSRGAPPK